MHTLLERIIDCAHGKRKHSRDSYNHHQAVAHLEPPQSSLPQLVDIRYTASIRGLFTPSAVIGNLISFLRNMACPLLV